MSSSVRAIAAALDDAALEALASKGLVRRAIADVASGRVSLVSEAAGSVRMAADGETVDLTLAGPAASRCSCPAPGVCRHRLAALVFLRQDAGEAAEAEGPPEADWSAVASTFTEERLVRFAGKAAWRDALTDLDLVRSAEVLRQPGALQVRLGGGEEVVVFLPSGGLEAALTKVPDKRRKALVAIAALAVRHALGLPEFAVEAPPEDRPRALPEPQSLEAVRDLLARLYRAALVFAPLSLEDEARRLAIAGRVEALPRLSALLRTIAGGVAAIRRRQADANPESLLALVAEAYAVTIGLETAADPGARVALTGTLRQTYDPLGEAHLYGLGAQRWETPGGAYGVTAYFHDPASGRDLRLTQARPDHTDLSFSIEGAFHHTAVWGATLRELSAGAVTLSGGQASPSGRLSSAQGTTARVSGWLPRREAIVDWPCSADDWEVLQGRLQNRFAAGLTAPRLDETAVILLQSRFAPLRFDELNQSLVWPIADRQGRWIGLTLPYEGAGRNRIETLERLAEAEPFWAVLAVASPVGQRIELRPYALWGKDQRLLDFSPPPPRPREAAPRPGLIDRLLARGRQPRFGPGDFTDLTLVADQVLDKAWALLLRQAEMGQALSSAQFRQEASRLADQLERVGLIPLGRLFRRTADDPSVESLKLAAAWAVVTARKARLRLPWMG